MGNDSQQQDPVAQRCPTPSHLTAITATALLVKVTRIILVGSSLTAFVPHAVEVVNSHHSQHFLASCLMYEILLLTALHFFFIFYHFKP